MKYWAYVNNEILGPFEKEKLLELPLFSSSLLVCPQTPVGEKTEDWKEASTYPELSALLGQGSQSFSAAAPQTFSPAPAVQETPAPAPEPVNKPLSDHGSPGFKPLTASKSLEPASPPAHFAGAAEITVNRLGKAAAAPQQASSFDPISLSHIERRSENISGQDISGPAGEGVALEPQHAFPEPAGKLPPVPPEPAVEPPSFTPAAEQSAGPVIENFSRPAAARGAAAPGGVVDTAGLESLIQRLDALAKTAATRQDINSAVDPLRLKLDQMGELVSSAKNPQFQREVMDKLVYLENALSEIKETLRTAQQSPAPAKVQRAEMESSSNMVFGAQPVRQAEKPKAEPARESEKPAEIADQGSKPSKIGQAVKKVFKLVVTLALLAAVLLVAVIGLKISGVFDASKFIPFPLPFISAGPARPLQPAAGTEQQVQPEQQEAPQPVPGQEAAQQQAAPEKPAQEQASPKALQAGVAPEIIYIARTFKLTPAGQSLENKIYEHAAKAGGDYNSTAWKVRPTTEGMFEIAAVIPAKTGSLTYTYQVDRANKTVLPSNEAGKAAFDALSKGAAKKSPARKAAKPKAALKPAPKPEAKKAAPEKLAAPEEEEYEYEYAEEDGTEQ